ncbi:SMI1/KNR4 family protein [Bacillus haynesii]|uniref:SMI1/KNR4 family protein n=1 Tax=Bacillus haynesii TaxID=1925021 RepID=UPI0022829120|nr:SMI1/KNR4 family protein [Bacillus haynesii]MCY7772026.1 SMI1/KNR4 family protein [Bacillus haynesii]MCY8066654.1 SMI1/KNR4 family protein [Bacillus haynesii]MCY8348170.1 SMI1/KNR4 family protein [Bacillus haynesii]MCY8349609.1 SMI1/KNR4 family protein [Bacillus haynesii]MCY8558361.1 SMI1/KNR4 family protein [Bacillus haynesii]
MKNFWTYEDEDPYTLKSISERDIQKAEKKLGVKLPEEYKALILEQNGGYINFNAFPSERPTSWAKDHVQVDYLLGLGKKEGILESKAFIKEWGLPDNLILIHGDGHTWIALDYREMKENPPVHYFDSEFEENFRLADSFGEFLSKLYTDSMDDDDCQLIEGVHPDIPYVYPEDAITKEEAEQILTENSAADLHQILYYPIKGLDDLNWLLTKIKESSLTANIDNGIELAIALESVIFYHKDLTLDNEQTRRLVLDIAAILKNLNDSVIDMLLLQIKDSL